MNKTRIEKVITLQKTRFLNFYHAIYKNKLGQEKNWFIASRKDEEVIAKQLLEGAEDRVDAVLLVAFHEEEQKLVLIKQFRVPINGYVYELPAGLIDPGEHMKEAAARELREETGLELTMIDEARSCQKAYLSPGMTDESVGMIYCQCKGELSKAFLEADEDIKAMLISKDEAKEILASGERIDIKAYMALQQFVMSE